MSHASEEIASQPSCWRAAIEVAAAKPAGLPEPGERVAVIGCGTSWFVAQAYAVLRERAGQGETDAFTASEFPVSRRYDRVVAISRSGTTTEILRALSQIDRPAKITAITAVAGSPVRDQADEVLTLGFADEQSVVQTRFPTTLITLLRAHLGEDVTGLPGQAERALGLPLPDDLDGFRQFTFLGSGWTLGLAHEAALKVREAAQAWSESYSGMEYRHGPIAVADIASLVWVFGDAPHGLLDEVRATGAHVEVSLLDPLAELVRAQRMAVGLADRRGLDVDAPRHLTRSVILT
ncbi:SIS domain-containing protein [Kibdelosporangium persicum]|uniref:Glutamine--fructose-6-phosphate aminotransferase [isomerizing] n=1 Tax=Kibdelosporangium persicum TaxID=2698649 RepID=A0ABX2F329_9PSEU|nr:SIS domain-containing protein [Kibdelosporangium persicum]NRN65405.1 putative phosphosugar isomerase [Kibdelosporangium persicum]